MEPRRLRSDGKRSDPRRRGPLCAARSNVDPRRERKCLLHRAEIVRLDGKLHERGFTLIPLELYFNADSRVKVELALARGKRSFDKRETIKRREEEREAQRALRRGRSRS